MGPTAMAQPKIRVDQVIAQASSLAKSGDLDGARAAFSSVLDRFPKNARAQSGLKSLEQLAARKIYPEMSEAAMGSVLHLLSAGRLPDALEAASLLVTAHPDAAAALNLHGICLSRIGRHRDAVIRFNAALKREPRYPEALANLGAAYLEMEAYGEAIHAAKAALAIRPGYETALNVLGSGQKALDRSDEAEATFRRLLAASPQYADAWNNLGTVLREAGRTDEACEAFERALTADPRMAKAYFNLSQVKTAKAGDALLGRARALADEAQLGDEDRAQLAFAIAKAAEDCGDLDAAFAGFAKGNSFRRRQMQFDAGREDARLDVLTRLFAKGVHDFSPGKGISAPRTIFIVGMPRSGTSLIEQILAAHPAVHAAGELPAAPRILIPLVEQAALLPDPAKSLPKDVKALQRDYCAAVAPLAGERQVVTDKLPANFQWIGHLALAFPSARFVHVIRDPRATAWSIYRQNFAGAGLPWACDFADIARYTRLYQAYMDLWQATCPERIYNLDYATLTKDPETGIRALLAACDLPFDPVCLDFHQTERTVRTASTEQVRRPIFQGSSDAWRNYLPHVAPMLRALGYPEDGSDPAAG